MCVCDYQFSDEDQSELTDRLKEMLDIDAAEDDLISNQEVQCEMVEEEAFTGVCVCGFCVGCCFGFKGFTVAPNAPNVGARLDYLTVFTTTEQQGERRGSELQVKVAGRSFYNFFH